MTSTAPATRSAAAPQVQAFFDRVGSVLTPGGLVIVYGPFKYLGEHTSASNAPTAISKPSGCFNCARIWS